MPGIASGRRWVLPTVVVALVALLVILASLGPRSRSQGLAADGQVAARSDPATLEEPSTSARIPVADDGAQATSEATAEDPEPGETAAEEEPEATIAGRVLLMDGTPLVDYGVQAKSTRPAIRPGGRVPSYGARTTADGSFAIAIPGAGTFDVDVVRAVVIPGGSREGIEAPVSGLELRLDALLVRLRADPVAIDDPEQSLPVAMRPFGEGPAPFLSSHATLELDVQDPPEFLLPTGPGYVFEVDRGSARPLVGVVDPGLPSGPVDVWLQESDPDLGTVHVVLSGLKLMPPNKVSVWLQTDDRAMAWATVEAPAREAWSGALLPGRYSVRPRVDGAPPFDWARAESTVDTIEVGAGDVATLEVELLPAGMVTVGISLPEDVRREERPDVQLEVRDAGTGDWRPLSMHRVLLDGGRELTVRLVPGRTYRSEELFPPGELRLRASAEGWRTALGTVVIQAGRESAWTPVLEPE